MEGGSTEDGDAGELGIERSSSSSSSKNASSVLKNDKIRDHCLLFCELLHSLKFYFLNLLNSFCFILDYQIVDISHFLGRRFSDAATCRRRGDLQGFWERDSDESVRGFKRHGRAWTNDKNENKRMRGPPAAPLFLLFLLLFAFFLFLIRHS